MPPLSPTLICCALALASLLLFTATGVLPAGTAMEGNQSSPPAIARVQPVSNAGR
jgi:hypothetical protein